MGSWVRRLRGLEVQRCFGAWVRPPPLQGADVPSLRNECILDAGNKASLFHRLANGVESAAPLVFADSFPYLLLQ